MKKCIFGFIALLLAVSNSQAMPLKNTRLELKQVPNGNLAGGKYSTVSVFSDGTVIEKFNTALPKPLPSILVTKLDAYQMDRIERLIESARTGRIVTTNSPVCMARALYIDDYTADNGKVFLLRSAKCQNPTFNDTFAAKRLVEILSDLRTQGSKLNQ